MSTAEHMEQGTEQDSFHQLVVLCSVKLSDIHHMLCYMHQLTMIQPHNHQRMCLHLNRHRTHVFDLYQVKMESLCTNRKLYMPYTRLNPLR